ncbi:fimbrial protein [Enterobacter roggenkampii]|uniref:fimbrial protein n=1 Tax=Enterobacter roggenkampii TaxID=1812935 RepID=UPI001237B7F4|nr:fimbrial protein [Enterobacter roggenkampii]
MKHNIFLIVCFITALLSLSAETYACAIDANGKNFSVDFGNITVQRDLPVGSQIAAITPADPGYFWSDYDGGCYLYDIMKYLGAKASTIADVYDTNIPGVGIKLSIATNNGSAFASPPPGSLIEINPVGGNGHGIFYRTAYLVKTGNITSGTLTAGEFAEILGQHQDGSSKQSVTYTIEGTNTITQVACALTTGDKLYLPIGDVPADQFKAAGTVSQQSSTVNLGLNCDAGANINITLNGQQSPDTSDKTVLAVSGNGNEGALIADGIGVQLMYNNAPIELNKSLNLKRSTGGQENFQITARYVQTKNQVRPGTANATATLNLTYQ